MRLRSLGLVQAEIDSQAQAGDAFVVVKLSGRADLADMHALITELRVLTDKRGALRILVDQTDLHPGRMGFNEIAEIVSDWRTAPALRASRIAVIAPNPIVRGLNQLFRLLANLEHKDSVNAFSKRADAVAWLVSKTTPSA